MSLNWIHGILAAATSCLFALTVASTAGSQTVPQQPPAQEAFSVLKSGQVDVRKSRAFARVAKTGLGHDHAIEGRLKQGFILLGAMHNAGSIVFDMTSFRADTAVARRYIGLNGTTSASTQQQTNFNMHGQSVLDVRRYPTAKFVIDSAVPIPGKSGEGHPLYKLTGKFTLHGTTRPLAINAEVIPEQDRVHLRGKFSIRQTRFGITPFKKVLGAVGVADQMTIYGEIYVGMMRPVAQNEPPGVQR